MTASTADKDKNRLDTGTLGWKDINNKADFTAEHTGGSIGTGGPIGSQLVTNAAGGLLSNANNSDHAEGTTQSAVSDGTVIVRNEDKQKQDVNELNRDTEHANDGSINPIFDKEKEQNRLKQSQLIGEIGNQTMDIIRTEGDIAGLKAQKDPDALAVAKKQLESEGKTLTDDAIKQQAYNNAMAQYGTGSDFQKAAQAVTGLLQGLAGDNLAGALANASSPYLATLIKQQVGEDNKAANAMAHAVLGAVVAELNNQSAAAGGLGAGGGELSAQVIMKTLFPNKEVWELSESEKQQVSALSQLASGLAGGLTTGDMAGAVTGSQAAKNAVENNYLSTNQLENFAHKARTCVGDECQKVVREMVDTNVRQQEEIKAVCSTSPEQCQEKYGYLVEQWEAFDTTIKNLAKDKSLPDEFRNYMPAVYMLGMEAEGITVEHGWTKRFEAMGFDAETAQMMAMTLPAMINGGSGKNGKGTTGKQTNVSKVEAEKNALNKIGENSKNTKDLSQKEANSVYNQQLIKNAEKISTAKQGQQTAVPRDLNEQTFWKEVQSKPLQGKDLPGLNNDPRFPTSAGFQKMEAKHKLPDGQTITIHYQYNSNTGKAYDMKITTPQRIQQDPKQVVDTIKDKVK